MASPSSARATVACVQLSDYQQRSRATAVYPDAGDNLTYPALGLCGEAGEAAEKVKKALRDDGGVLTDERRAALAAELGDVLWYVAQLATEAGLDLDTIAEENLSKLLSRQERGVLAGQRRHALAASGASSVFLPSNANSSRSTMRKVLLFGPSDGRNAGP